MRDRSDRDVEDWRKSRSIQLIGLDIPKPVLTFDEAVFPKYIREQITACGFKEPTPIQAQGWPMALSGRDMIGIAQTGSGKTLAFILPAIVHINAQPLLAVGEGPIALVLSPTRELAIQTDAECQKFGATSKIKHTVGGIRSGFTCSDANSFRVCLQAIYGGQPKSVQARALAAG